MKFFRLTAPSADAAIVADQIREILKVSGQPAVELGGVVFTVAPDGTLCSSQERQNWDIAAVAKAMTASMMLLEIGQFKGMKIVKGEM